ncbi:DUF5060 domain-containing protein [bacterium]|nr:DUF5060 domain-containing protein [bacterium]
MLEDIPKFDYDDVMGEKVILRTCLCFIMLGLILTGCADEKKINFRTEIKKAIRTYQQFELTFDLKQFTGNPFNPENIEVTATFYSPKREKIHILGFLYQDYQRSLPKNGNVSLVPKGQPCWKIRFTPTQKGIYYYQLHLKNKLNIYHSRRRKLHVTSSDTRGFIRVSPEDRRYFEFDSGSPYFAVGHNLCWYSSNKGTYDYDYYFSRMKEAGENYTRIWLSPWAFALEWEKLGSYNMADAWRLDYVLNLAESRGIYVMLCIDTFNTLNSTSTYGKWSSNLYNKTNGGPCAKPEEFFTSPQAKKYYKQKLRYIIARWGYSPNVLAWELWNEVDFTDNYSSENVWDWHKEIIQYLSRFDPYKHLVTTSYFQNPGDTKVFQLPGINFTQSRTYESKDIVLTIQKLGYTMNTLYAKPHLVGEFAITHSNQDSRCDPKGYYLHDGIWSTVFSLAAGTAMSWWWDSHIDQNNLYYHFKALAEFVKDVKWTKENYQFRQIKCYHPGNSTPSILVRTHALVNKDNTNLLLWIQNKSDKRMHALNGEILGLRTGNYLIYWWDTYQGIILKKEEIKCADGSLLIAIPSFNRDIAAKISYLE